MLPATPVAAGRSWLLVIWPGISVLHLAEVVVHGGCCESHHAVVLEVLQVDLGVVPRGEPLDLQRGGPSGLMMLQESLVKAAVCSLIGVCIPK